MIGLGEIWSFVSMLRDHAYDTVFEIGDTGLQFGAELMHGPQNYRYGQYAKRQIDRQQKKLTPKAAKKSTQQANAKPQKVVTEKPLKFEEKKIFSEMMRRQNGESIIAHWKRQKTLLADPQKQTIIAHHVALNAKLNQEQARKNTITIERRKISSQYQKERVPKPTQKKSKSMKRTRTR